MYKGRVPKNIKKLSLFFLIVKIIFQIVSEFIRGVVKSVYFFLVALNGIFFSICKGKHFAIMKCLESMYRNIDSKIYMMT